MRPPPVGAAGVDGCHHCATASLAETQPTANGKVVDLAAPGNLESADRAGVRLTPGSQVTLRALHPLGVPFHPQAGSREVSGRLPDGSRVVVVGVDAQRRWLEIRVAAGRAFIVAKYVMGSDETMAVPRASARDSDLESCRRRLVGASGRSQRHLANGTPRIGSFNVRWFPDGGPGRLPRAEGTDIPWVACEIAELEAEIVALQEFKTTERARQASEMLCAELDRLTQGKWKIFFDDCPQPTGLHVGLLYDSQRARLERRWTEPSLNPLGSACEGALRPGLAGDFALSDGSFARVISVHLKSGTDRRSYELRRATFGAVAHLPPAGAGRSQVIAGDWNTMGCSDCVPAVSGARERELLELALASGELSLVEASLGCSHFHQGAPELLDGFLVDKTHEQTAASLVFGVCRLASCQAVPRGARVFDRVSDHCPLALDLGGPRTTSLPSSRPPP